jgi:uncharacterized protein YyaL (SSP411 family)
VVLATYRPGEGVGHVVGDASIRGLLTDQVRLAGALLDAKDAAAREPYGMLAAELLHFACNVLWDAAGGGFLDRAEPGDPLKPFALNCDAARVLARAAAESGEPIFRERARETLEALERDARGDADATVLALAVADARGAGLK